MLHEFLETHREDLIARTRAKVAARMAPRPSESELKNGVPLFLDQLVEALRLANPSAESGAIGISARLHGGDLLKMGFTVAQVVHDYGDICQAVTELADETDATITTDEFHTLNRCLDDAIAQAVTEFTEQRDLVLSHEETQRSGMLAHELRNRISAANLAFSVIQKGNVAINGGVGAVVARSLRQLSALVDRSLLEVRATSTPLRPQRVDVWELIEEAQVDGMLEANARHLSLTVPAVARGIYVDVDPPIVSGAIANLLHNAFKFTHDGGHVWLTATASDTRVLIDVQDECGGLPPGKADDLFHAFEQRSTDRTGVGLGLFISRQGVEASGGQMRVRDLPGAGCVFTIDLPRFSSVSGARALAANK